MRNRIEKENRDRDAFERDCELYQVEPPALRLMRQGRFTAEYLREVARDQAEAGRTSTARDYRDAARLISDLADYIARQCGEE